MPEAPKALDEAQPAPPKPAPKASDVDNLFEETPKAPAKPAKPASSDVENLFEDTPKAPKSEGDTEPAKPAAKPASDLDNLFEEPAKMPKKDDQSAAKPAAPSDVENLFDEGPKKPEKTATPASFEEPTLKPANGDAANPLDAPAKPAPAKDKDLDNLFEEPAEKAPAKSSAASRSSAPLASSAEIDDLFAEAAAQNASPAAVKPAPQQALASADSLGPTRVWIDNTGKFQVTAQLVVVLDGKVRLLKDTGRFTTVPFERLSEADLQYVLDYAKLAANAAVAR